VVLPHPAITPRCLVPPLVTNFLLVLPKIRGASRLTPHHLRWRVPRVLSLGLRHGKARKRTQVHDHWTLTSYGYSHNCTLFPYIYTYLTCNSFDFFLRRGWTINQCMIFMLVRVDNHVFVQRPREFWRHNKDICRPCL
jgi:hypothetical protein